jgi:beta-barrel assembly-enhancing protease
MKITSKLVLFSFTSVLLLAACSGNGKKLNFNTFTVQQDRELGAQVAAEIDANQTEYPLLDSASNTEVYAYLYAMRDKILNSGNVVYKDEFPWRLRIIQDDSTLNAFCTPGGYIYVYTGLMRYLDSEDQLAGVLGHEIGHADLRHSTRQMTKSNSLSMLLAVLAGDRAMLQQLTSTIVNLKFSRNHETEADEASVRYLCPTDYNADAGAKFFEKIQAEGGAGQPEFLSTHPAPANRIENFKKVRTEMGCTGEQEYKNEHQRILSLLPR